MAEDNSYGNADDDLFTLPQGAVQIGLPHLLEMPAEDAAAFGQLFADYELLPPFRQLDRSCYTLTTAELAATETDPLGRAQMPERAGNRAGE